MEEPKSIVFLEHFKNLRDRRIERKKLYPLEEILLITLCAVICGAESWRDMVLFGREKLEFLRKYLPFENGVPSKNTFARVYAHIDPESFKNCFIGWVKSFQTALGNIIAIDGKTLRHSFDNAKEKPAIHMVSAFASQWEWETPVPVPELETSIFVVPGRLVKNRDDRVIVLNTIAKEVIDKQRGKHNRFVFTYQNKPLSKINNSAWKNARKKAGLVQVRVHDLKHTFGRRLRSAGVSFEDRQDLLGHRSGRITTHYSAAEFQNLLAAACKACDRSKQGVGLLLKNKMKQVEAEISNPHKIPANDFEGCVQKEAISS